MLQAVHKHMQLELNRLKWEHAQEIEEIRHNAGKLFSYCHVQLPCSH